MEAITSAVTGFVDLLWGPWTFFALLGVGILFSVWTKFVQWRVATHGVAIVRGVYDDPNDPGAINHFQALSAALSGTVGLGNIGGVALAIGIGGPGALFWMWLVALLGIAIKAVEITLAMMYRNEDDPDKPSGGAMWVVEKVLGARGGAWAPAARGAGVFFSLTLLVSTITGGNIFQAWNVAGLTQKYFGVPDIVTCIVMATVVGAVIIGGIKRIGSVAGRLVPAMAFLYIAASLAVVARFVGDVPDVLFLVVQHAFEPAEATGAFIGAGTYFAFTVGLKRALFSNEAGQGSAPIAHAAARTDEPAREGIVGGLGPIIDTLIICTLTALVILLTGTWNREAVGPLQLDPQIVHGEAGWTLDGVGELAALPTLPGGEAWTAGDAVFVVGVVADGYSEDTGNDRVRFEGSVEEITAADEGNGRRAGDLYLAWGTVDAPADARVALVDAGVYRADDGAVLTAAAFDRAFPGLGKWLVTLAAWLFAISTMISWAYYGEQGVVYIAGHRPVLAYKLFFLVAAASAPVLASNVDALLLIADLGTGLMLWGNLPILVGLGYLAVRAVNDYNARLSRGEIVPHDPRSVDDLINE